MQIQYMCNSLSSLILLPGINSIIISSLSQISSLALIAPCSYFWMNLDDSMMDLPLIAYGEHAPSPVQ